VTSVTEPRDVPILFSGPMVRAILAGRKVQTRRILNPQPGVGQTARLYQTAEIDWQICDARGAPVSSHKLRYRVGDRLWVRETCRAEECKDTLVDGVRYFADDAWIPIQNTKEAAERWVELNYYNERRTVRTGNIVPSIHMPRWASRAALEVTAIRIERLQDITEEDAKAEGIYWSDTFEGWTSGAGEDETCDFHQRLPVLSFAKLWMSINGAGSWGANPWCCAIQFRTIPSKIITERS
jgi:hypothetical protein